MKGEKEMEREEIRKSRAELSTVRMHEKITLDLDLPSDLQE